MARISPSLLRITTRDTALQTSVLQRVVGDIPSALNELRWLREHAQQLVKSERDERGLPPPRAWRERAREMVYDRGVLAKPLQYILGTQPFGELEILCQEGVLIPRQETEDYVTRLARMLARMEGKKKREGLGILDLCSGTGCISLLLHSLLVKEVSGLRIWGVDVDDGAVWLAQRNLMHNVNHTGVLAKEALAQVRFLKGDVLGPGLFKLLDATFGEVRSTESERHRKEIDVRWPGEHGKTNRLIWDVVICNPPYISEEAFGDGTTEPSVRKWEPALALVPPTLSSQRRTANMERPEMSLLKENDTFYPTILKRARQLGAKCVVMEVGDTEQAKRVKAFADTILAGQEAIVEIWRDGEGIEGGDTAGHGRAVVCWLDDWAKHTGIPV